MKKKYSLNMAIAMVVGIIIGAGVFFKSSSILVSTGGNLYLGLLSWLIGGVLVISSAYAFAILTTDFNINGGINQFADKTIGKRYGFFTGFYSATIYTPCIVTVISWLCAKYTLVLFGYDSNSIVILLSYLYVAFFTLLNLFAPIISGRIQVSTTIIKLIPIVFVAIAGVIYGLFFSDGKLIYNLTNTPLEISMSGMWKAICATVFAYEGWICVTSINDELKDGRKNFPKALIIGSIICILSYMLYYIGLSGTKTNIDLINGKDLAVKDAFKVLLGGAGGTILYVFVLISGFGCLNGVTIANIRGYDNLSYHNKFRGSKFIQKHKTKEELSVPSAMISMILAFIWLGIWFLSLNGKLGISIDIAELAIVFIYLFYIPIYIYIIIKNKNSGFLRRYFIPIVAIISALIVLISGIMAHTLSALIYFIFCIIIFGLAFILQYKYKA